MHGNNRPRFPTGGGGTYPRPPPNPHPSLQPQYNPNFGIHNPNIYFPNPAFQLLHNFNQSLLLQNPNLVYNQFPPNPNTLQPQAQNHSWPPVQSEQPPCSSTSYRPQPQAQTHPQGHLQSEQPPSNRPQSQPQQKPKKELLERAHLAVVRAWDQIIAEGESVTSWKICQSVALMLKVDSWSSLGLKMQEVQPLRELMVIESKINAFIHCFVGVRKISTLYELEEAICKSEGVRIFEELKLGPFLRHQLVMHYFSVNSYLTEVIKITYDDVITLLAEFMGIHKIKKDKKKDVKIEEFLDFIAKTRSLGSKERLGVRVQNLGVLVQYIREAKRSEDVSLRKFLTTSLPAHNHHKHPLISSSRFKKMLDKRFSAISERVKCFSSMHEDFCGQHIRFVSSSSDDEEGNDCTDEDDNDVSHLHFSSHSNSSDRVSGCPYPSATEERSRLGLMDETTARLSLGSVRPDENSGFSKKRKFDKLSCHHSAPAKLQKKVRFKDNPLIIGDNDDAEDANCDDHTSSCDKCIMTFITTFKEACKDHTADQVLSQMIEIYKLQFPKGPRVRKLKSIFSSFPFVGLLNIAVASIKEGMWDSVYDTFQAIGQGGSSVAFSDKCSEYENIEVEPNKTVAVANTEHAVDHANSFTVEEILKRTCMFFELNHDDKLIKEPVKNVFTVLRKLRECETWLTGQFCIKEFKTLGYGDFFEFLEKHASELPTELQSLFVGMSDTRSFEVSLLQHLLVVLVSQASNNLGDNFIITKQIISTLLTRQFPSLCFKIIDNGSMEKFLEVVGKSRSDVISKCVLFSETLIGMSTLKENALLETQEVKNSSGLRTELSVSATSRDAIQVLLRAPMLSDLNSWSHWDLVFAPSLGSLLEWLLNEVSAKDLLCLVSKDGKVIRLDNSATADSFLEAAIEGSAFQTAVKLLSLLALAGGEKHVPLSLLKCHARHAFEVMFRNCMEGIDGRDAQASFKAEREMNRQQMLDKVVANKLIGDAHKAVTVVVGFFLDCVGYLPSEFHGFAADLLLAGLRPVIKNAPREVLRECNQVEQRLMLHEVGLSLGIVEWVNDYHTFRTTSPSDPLTCQSASLKTDKTEISTRSKLMQHTLDKPASTEAVVLDLTATECSSEECSEAFYSTQDGESSHQEVGDFSSQQLSEVGDCKDAASIIEYIRQEEFGLDSSLSSMESSMLKKQHARLGRALHCLSQELYSQDSHFLLELVQNADDNMYPKHVEPTLTFILQESGIVVLNNELGFSSQNIRALCDVGNSTKKGSGSGYIGQKGIGFKSVFRVTDAPEIHSNGFHVKFDISEGQIGFVLPTIVPPCNMLMLSRLISRGPVHFDNNCWNTCIRLPFRSKLSEGVAINNIVAMFSDLHPSLLLFLHRLQCIIFRDLLNDLLIVMRKEIVGDGIVKVSCGEEKMTWFVASKKLQADVMRNDVQSTEISIAFTLQEKNGSYYPQLDPQPVFAFLPLRTYGLKFILQGDFVLPSSREEVDGNSSWNQWLLSEFPGLFVSAQKSFCHLPCFRENPAKAVAAYLSFVPLVGEVHGFFSCLPRMIISNLRVSNCLLLEGDSNHWVPPCKVLRGWNDEARNLLTDSLLHDHLGLGFLNKDIVLSDSLAKALGIEEYGTKVLLQILVSLCREENGLTSMGLGWLASWLNSFYTVFRSSEQSALHSETASDIIDKLQKVSFIPLSDGTFSSVNEGTIWLHTHGSGYDGGSGCENFPNLYAKLRTVNPALLKSAAASDITCVEASSANNVTRMLLKTGVQLLSAHDIVTMHILPAFSAEMDVSRNRSLLIEYLCFVMIHLQSSCTSCHIERESIFSELRHKAFISTNYSFRRLAEVSIHFGKEFGNPIDVSKLLTNLDIKWYEVDLCYLNHPATEHLPSKLDKWRSFLQEIGVTDFVQVVQVDKSVADLPLSVIKEIGDRELVSPPPTVKDWESVELVHLLSKLCSTVDRESCKYLLEILDTVWDNCYSDKTACHCNFKPSSDGSLFKSSFLCNMRDAQWAVSSMDDELHLPKDLFHDCDSVRSILGSCAPYMIPKVKSQKLVHDIGLKTEVSIDDILKILKVWRNSRIPFKASIAQMSRLYTYVRNEMVASEHKIADELLSGSFIFVPYSSTLKHEDVINGVFLSPEEVCWHDPTGTVDLIKEKQSCNPAGLTQHLLNKALCNVYPGFYDFFVKMCGVHEGPSSSNYLEILKELSTLASPSEAANAVFQVFLRWAEAMISGSLNSEDIIHLKDHLLKLEYTILPTAQDKWVSLHSSYGLVCWCDEKKLRKRFKHLDGIDYLYFGNLSVREQEMLQSKVYPLLQALGIPALSEVVTREAIYYGVVDCSFKSSLINWALPYAQRYVSSLHPDNYLKLKQSGFDSLKCLQIVVVEKLFYRNVIKGNGAASKKRYKCSCLLQGNFLYATEDSDKHALYMELSGLFLDGIPKLHLANFLDMITTKVESGSTEDEMEFFILKKQNLPKLPSEEPAWSLSSACSSLENNGFIQKSLASSETEELTPLTIRRKGGGSSSWPPADWKTAPGFSHAHVSGFKTQAVASHTSGMMNDIDEAVDTRTDGILMEIDDTLPIGDEFAVNSAAPILQDSENLDYRIDPVVDKNGSNVAPCRYNVRPRLYTGQPNYEQAMQTGRDGEAAAFKHFTEVFGKKEVKWVNKDNETGLPYDIVVGKKKSKMEYIEVKATKSARKDWFNITMREWQFALEMGEAFSVAHVLLRDNEDPEVTVYKDPAKLCKQGKLQLVILMPR